jgi:hypothetical protein
VIGKVGQVEEVRARRAQEPWSKKDGEAELGKG